jgi:tetratricopeptide (TPR) repeat protein
LFFGSFLALGPARAQPQAKSAQAAQLLAARDREPSRTPTRAELTLAEARAHFEQGQAAYRSGQLKQALAHFTRAYELAPSPELDFDLARVYERVGEPASAIAHLRAYVREVELEDADRQQIEARIASLEALRARQRAPLLQTPPTNAALTAEARAFFDRGNKLFKEGSYAAALVAFAAARRFAPLPELTYNLAVTAERLGHASEAVDYYRQYLREAKHPPDEQAVQTRVRALLTDRSPPPSSR